MLSQAPPRFHKDPDATLDFSVDWSDWLGTDTITDVEWIVPAGVENEGESNTTTVAVVLLSGGTAGKTYRVTCRITTENGLTDDRSFDVAIVST